MESTLGMPKFVFTCKNKSTIDVNLTILSDSVRDGSLNYFVYNRIMAIKLHCSIVDLRGILENLNCTGYTANYYYLQMVILKMQYLLSTIADVNDKSTIRLRMVWRNILTELISVRDDQKTVSEDVLFSDLFG